jgi:hypothetical protein
MNKNIAIVQKLYMKEYRSFKLVLCEMIGLFLTKNQVIKLGMVTHAYNASTLEGEAEELWV